MLINDLKSIIKTLEQFIEITKSDIEDIKEAKHEVLFKRNPQKEALLKDFNNYKSLIDRELLNRSQTRGMDNLLNNTENDYLDIFKEKLSEFELVHKKFSKMVFSVSNFYTNLMHKVTESEIQIGYEIKPNRQNPYLKLRG
jgi:hypothetical protein